MHRRLQRRHVSSAFDRDATGLSRGIVSNIGRGLIDAGHHLLFTGRDTGGGLPCAARRLLSTGGDLVDATRYLLLTSGDSGRDLVDATRYLLLTGGDPVDALSHRVEIKRHCVELLLIERGRGRRRERDHVGSALRNRFGWRPQPTEQRVQVCDHLSRRAAI